jgi:hypothetical protein
MSNVVEIPIEFMIDDPNTGVTITRKGRRFLILREVKEQIDQWRNDHGNDITLKPTPYRGDYIVVADGIVETKYQIDSRDPYSIIGSNNSVYQINTILV